MIKTLSPGATLSQRVRYAQQHNLVSSRELADSVQSCPDDLQAWLESADMTDTVLLSRIAEVLSVDLPWLVTGLGHPQRLDAVMNDAEVELLSVVRNLSPMSRNALLATAQRMLETEQAYQAEENAAVIGEAAS